MRLAANDPQAVVTYGSELPDPRDSHRELRISGTQVRRRVLAGIRRYFERVLPGDLNQEQVSDRLDISLTAARRSLEPREMRVTDFLLLMYGLGRHPVFALRELAIEIEAATDE